MFVTIRKHKLSGQKIAGHGLVYGDLTKKNIPLFKRSFGWDHFCIAVEIRESESETWWPDNFEISQLILCPTNRLVWRSLQCGFLPRTRTTALLT